MNIKPKHIKFKSDGYTLDGRTYTAKVGHIVAKISFGQKDDSDWLTYVATMRVYTAMNKFFDVWLFDHQFDWESNQPSIGPHLHPQSWSSVYSQAVKKAQTILADILAISPQADKITAKGSQDERVWTVWLCGQEIAHVEWQDYGDDELGQYQWIAFLILDGYQKVELYPDESTTDDSFFTPSVWRGMNQAVDTAVRTYFGLSAMVKEA